LSGRCPKFSGLLLKENTCGTNVARLRISVWFVGFTESAGINRHVGVSKEGWRIQ